MTDYAAMIDALAAHLEIPPDVLHALIASGEVKAYLVLVPPYGGETRFPLLPVKLPDAGDGGGAA